MKAILRSFYQNTTSNRKFSLIALLMFFVLGFLVYAQTVGYDYTNMDDNKLISSQMDRLSKFESIPHAFTEDVFHKVNKQVFYYRPMLTISYSIDAMVSGGKLSWFHISNILLHILAAWGLLLFLIELNYDRMKSFFFTLIFLLHPVLTQAVAWLPGRNDLLLALFLFPAMVFLIRWSRKGKTTDLLLHFGFYILALFSKETAIVAPVLALFYLLMTDRKIVRKHLYPAIGWIIITGSWLALRNHVMAGFQGFAITDSISSVLHNLIALVPYIGKSVIPVGLSVLPFLHDMSVAMVAGIIALIGLTVLLVTTKDKRWGNIVFAVLWFLLFLIPSFVRIQTQEPDFMEHRVYISLAGLLFFVMETDIVKRAEWCTRKFLIPLLTVVAVFGSLTFVHSRDYKNKIVFWSNAVKTSPSQALCYKNLGAMYFMDNNLPDAEKYNRQSLVIDPTEKVANYNLGAICLKTGRMKEAENFFEREIAINPTYNNAYFSLGILYANSNRIEQAIALWEKYLTINPQSPECYNNLMVAYKSLNRATDAERIRSLALKNRIRLSSE